MVQSKRVGPWLAAAFILLLVCTTGCGQLANQPALPAPAEPAEPGNSTRLQIFTTVYPLYEFTRTIGGSNVDTKLLLPPGADPHDYEPGPRDLEALTGAHMFVYSGANFEPWAAAILPSLSAQAPQLLLVETAADIELLPPGRPDPHVWLDPMRAIQQVETITAALATVHRAGAAEYERRSAQLTAQLTALSQRYDQQLASCRQRQLFVQHAAFYYWERYGLTQEALTSGDHTQEPSPRRLAHLVKLMETQGATAVFADAHHRHVAATTLAAETGSQLLTLHSVESLTPAELERGENYFSLMEQNLANLRAGLDCEPTSAP